MTLSIGKKAMPETRTDITALYVDAVPVAEVDDEERFRNLLSFQKMVRSVFEIFQPRLYAVNVLAERESSTHVELIPAEGGALLVLDHGPEAQEPSPDFSGLLLWFAIDFFHRFQSDTHLPRAAMASGEAFRFRDFRGNTNFAEGAAILAQKLARLADPGQILLTEQSYRSISISPLRRRNPLFDSVHWFSFDDIDVGDGQRTTVFQVVSEAFPNLNNQPPGNVAHQLRNEDLREKAWAIGPGVLQRIGVSKAAQGRIRYADNLYEHSSDLVVFLSGLGLNHHDFARQISELDYRCVAFTLFGFHPEDEESTPISLSLHCEILQGFLRYLRNQVRPRTMTLVGFSIGADLFAKMLRENYLSGAEVQNFLALDCNLGPHTCFLSRRLAQLQPGEDPARFILETNRDLVEQGEGFPNWIRLQKYFIDVFGSHGESRLSRVSNLARRIVQEFEGMTTARRLQELSELSQQVKVRCLFSDNPDNDVAPTNQDSRFHVEILRGFNHFDLCQTAVLHRHLKALNCC